MKAADTQRAETGIAGRRRILLAPGVEDPVVSQILSDPGARVPVPRKRSQEEKLRARRAVYSFPARFEGADCRLYLKLYRVRGPKDLLEDLLRGPRAFAALAAGVEAERRGIPVARHLGASAPARRRLLPGTSALLLLGLPHRRDVRTVLAHELPRRGPDARRRARLLAELGRTAGLAHRRGLLHGDMKIRNFFVLGLDPPRLALIDLDRSRFTDAPPDAWSFGRAHDLRRLLGSLDSAEGERTTRRERLRVIVAYRRALGASRRALRRLLFLASLIGAHRTLAGKERCAAEGRR